MKKFRYSEYLSQFRNVGNKSNSASTTLPGGRTRCADRRRLSDSTSECEDAADPVILAIRRGDVKAVNDLAVSSPHDLMMENSDGWIPLHEAAYCGETECMKTLLQAHPVSVDKRTLQEQTALFLAVSGRHLSCVRCLLEAGADPDISNKNKETPLYKACERDNEDMVSLFLSFGASVNQRCGQGWTALHEAVSRNNTVICEMLLRAGATLNPPHTYSIPPLIIAAQQGQLQVLCYLIGKGLLLHGLLTPYEQEAQTEIPRQGPSGRYKVVTEDKRRSGLCHQGPSADVNMQTCDGATALYEASKNGHKEITAMLLINNADANKPTNSGLLPLHMAAQYGHHEIVSLLVPVTSRARLRHSWIPPLHLAAEHDRHMAAAVLLKTGADVNATLSPSRSTQYADRRATALYFAVANGSTETAELLLNAGASASLDPVSPLLMALRQGCARTVSLLLEKGADVDTGIPAYPTTFPGAVALCANDLSLLKCLLDNGCNALSCFTCAYGNAAHPPSRRSAAAGNGQTVLHNDGVPPLTCTKPPEGAIQFCEWLSTMTGRNGAGPIVDLLLDYVGQVQLCPRLTELLDSQEEWMDIKTKLLSPRPLMHLCRLRINAQLGRHRLLSVNSLPLPDRLIRYL